MNYRLFRALWTNIRFVLRYKLDDYNFNCGLKYNPLFINIRHDLGYKLIYEDMKFKFLYRHKLNGIRYYNLYR